MSSISGLSIGVLGIQGDWRAHLGALQRVGIKGVRVTVAADLTFLDGVILPGGESSAMTRALEGSELGVALRTFVRERSKPVMGTCAGAILLAGRVLSQRGRAPGWLGVAGCTVSRNAYGGQLQSFVEDIDVEEVGVVRGAFIRAPKFTEVEGWDVLGRSSEGDPVLVRKDTLVLCAFHPELGCDNVHKWFAQMCMGQRRP